LLMHVLVHEANLQDHEGGKVLLAPLKPRFPRLKLIWADSAYKKGDFVEWENRTAGLGYRGGGASLEWATRRPGAQRGCHRLGADPPAWVSRPQTEMGGGTNAGVAVEPFAGCPKTMKCCLAVRKRGSTWR
jgi:hypothetical protein